MKSKSIAIVLALFLGGFGAQHFYLNRNIAGVLSVLFFWTFIPSIIAIINLIQLLIMSDETFNEKYKHGK